MKTTAPNPSTPEATRPVKVLRKTLEMFGPDGERWANHSGPLDTGTCVWGGIYQAIADMTGIEPHSECDIWVSVLGFETSSEMFRWNDDEQRTWPEVKQRIEAAIFKAERGQ